MSLSDLTHWFSKEFAGDIYIGLGVSWYGSIGSYLQYNVGTYQNVVCSPMALIMGFPPSDTTSPVWDLMLGLGDDVDACYGQRITTTYGGPNVEIIRGPSLRMYTPTAMGWSRKLWPVPEDYAEGADLEMEQTALTQSVFLLGMLTNLVSTTLELYINVKYTSTTDTPKSLEITEKVLENIPPRILALAYYLELAQGWLSLAQLTAKHLVRIVKSIGTTLALLAAGLGTLVSGAASLVTGLVPPAEPGAIVAAEESSEASLTFLGGIGEALVWYFAEGGQMTMRGLVTIIFVVGVLLTIATTVGVILLSAQGII